MAKRTLDMFGFRKNIILFWSFLSVTTFAFSQQAITKFSSNPDEFLVQIQNMFAETNTEFSAGLPIELAAVFPVGKTEVKKQEKINKEANKVLKARYQKLKIESDFAYQLSTPKFNEAQIEAIVKTCNKMLEYRLKPIPHFESYFLALLSFINTKQSSESFTAWTTAIDKLLSENKRYFTTFIDNCNNIFLYRSVYVSTNLKWIRTSDNYQFDYDSLPKVVFPKMDLYCLTKGDTSYIYGTEGSYYLTKNLWVGKGGKVLWTRAGISPSVSYAMLSDYTIEMQSSFYTADSVTYVNSKYFKEEVIGRLEEKVLADQKPEKAVYPQFYSYSESVKIEELEKNIDFEGGFLIKGAKLIGKGQENARCKVTFKRNNEPFLVVEGNSFTINEERIATNSAKIVMYLDSDSIFHPSVQMKFLIEKRELTLYRQGNGLSGSPYYNTFHNMDMYVEWLSWKVDQPQIEFSTIVGSSNDEMVLESSSYYSPERFTNLQGLSEVHPFYEIISFIEKKNNADRTFLDVDLAKHFKLDDESVKLLLIKYANMGFLMYDINKGVVTVRQRLFDYIAAKSKKGDYDNITILSKMKGKPNAVLNLDNYDINIEGVSGVVISQVRKTGFIPSKQKMTLHKNRNMTFGGILRSGNYELHGAAFDFTYDDFKLDFAGVDSVRLKAANKKIDKKGEESAYTMVGSVIENVTGSIEIDEPSNKSALRMDSFPEFPIFKTTQPSYVKYDRRNKRGKAYDPQRVFFKLEPFTVDSLEYFTNAGISFPGTFTSGGIFPDLEEKLVLMPDHSLGFTRKTSYSGEPVYGGKGVFKNNIKVSNEGIMGDGEFEYITSITKSDGFVFYLDSMNAYAQDYTIDEQTSGTEYPDVIAKNVNVHYEPGEDFMTIKNTTFPMTMYNYEARLDGMLRYDHKAMTGGGLIDFDNAELTSKLFDFKHTVFTADTSDFKLKAEDVSEGIAFTTKNVKSMIDLKKRFGEFTANGGSSYVEFPVNQYVCYMDQFKWFMDQYELELSSNKANAKSGDESATAGDDLDLSGSEFISTNALQDSLKFVAPKANYDLKKYIIKAHEVKYINVADARIYTADGEITVKKDADMQPLENAEIIANVTTKYHTIRNAKVLVKARRNYTAEGDYNYVDASGNEQKVHFDNIRVDTAYQTIASGEIGENQKFMLNQYFAYKGTTSIEANKLEMFFRGSTQLVHSCDLMKPWLSFQADIDPKNVMIPIKDDVQSVDTKAYLYSGVSFNRDSAELYNLFLGPKKYYNDKMFALAYGFLKYDEDLKEYQISSKEKLNENSFPGNYVSLNTETCEIKGEGLLDLTIDNGQMYLKTAGQISSIPGNDSTNISAMMVFDFLLDPGMWKSMSDKLEAAKLNKVGLSENYVEKGIREIAGKQIGDKLVSELNLNGTFKNVPDVMVHSLILSDVKLYWNKKKKSYRSQGEIGVGLIGNTQIHKYVTGYVEIINQKNKEEINVYLEVNSGTWYFFSYSKGVMKCLSSSPDFNSIIGSVKPEKKELKGDKKVGPYTYILATELQKLKFLTRMEEE